MGSSAGPSIPQCIALECCGKSNVFGALKKRFFLDFLNTELKKKTVKHGLFLFKLS